MYGAMAHFLETYMRGVLKIRGQANMCPPEGYEYSCFEDYILRQGHLLKSTALTEEELELVWETLEECRAQGLNVHERRQCFANSQFFVMHAEPNAFAYYEGYAVRSMTLPLISTQPWWTGNPVPPTWKLPVPASRKLLPNYPLGDLPEPFAYWGVRFKDTDYMRHRIMKRALIGSLIDDWEGCFPLLRGINPNDQKSWSSER